MYRLMIVDDERLVRQGLVNIIHWRELGLEVVAEAGCVGDARALAAEKCPELLLTDIQMPDGTGLELIESLQKILPNLRSVVISGYSDFKYAVDALKLRVEDYILKPIDPAEICRVFGRITEMLDEERQQQAWVAKANYACTEYDMIQRLYHDLQEEDFAARHLEGHRQYRLVIIRQLDYSYDWGNAQEADICLPAELELFLKGRYHIRTDGILLTLLPRGCGTEAYINGLLAAMGSQAARYRVVVSDEAEDEGVNAYLAVAPLLYAPAAGPVLYQNSGRQERAAYNITSLRKALIEKLENGRPAGDVLRRLVAEAGAVRPGPRNVYLHVLQEVSRYFKIDGWAPSEALRAPAAGGAGEYGALTDAFWADIDALTGEVRKRGGSMAEVLTQKAVREIEAHYAKPDFTLAKLAWTLNVSYGYLSALFSRTTGKGFAAYLGEVRIEKARGLLLRRDLKVYEVAHMVGYGNTRYFSDAFRKAMGVSPSEYVARVKGGADDAAGG